MPIYELGYRHWEGRLVSPLLRWWSITRTGISLAFRSKVLRRVLYFAWAPLLYFGPLFFAVGYITDPSREFQASSQWNVMAKEFFGPELGARLVNDPESVRPLVWSVAFSYFFMFSQGILTFLVAGIVGPPLIAQDVRSKAFLLYFSKPINRWEYLLGKAGVVLFYVFLVTLFPALVLYVLSIAFSPSLGTLPDTGVMVLRIGLASGLIAVPSTLLVLCLSSVTRDSRYAAFGWFAIWVLGEVFFRVLQQVEGLRNVNGIFLGSIHETISVLVGAVFDVPSQIQELRGAAHLEHALTAFTSSSSPALAAAGLAVLSVVCLAVLLYRVSAPMRI